MMTRAHLKALDACYAECSALKREIDLAVARDDSEMTRILARALDCAEIKLSTLL